MKRNDLVKTLIIMLSTVIATVGLALLLNLHTGPIIEANKAGAANELLLNVIPDGSFEELYNSENISNSKLTVLPQTIVLNGKYSDKYTAGTSGSILSVYKEKSGKGYAFRFEISTQYSTTPMEVTVGVDPEGKIIKVNLDIYTESKAFNDGDKFISSFVGNDSTLAGVELVAGVSWSSAAIETGVEYGLLLLADNGYVQAGKKAIEQIFEESISNLYNGFMQKGQDLEVEGNIYTAYTSYNDSIVVCYVNKGEEKLLVLANASDIVKVYKPNLVDEASEVYELVEATGENTDVVTEVKAFIAKKNLSKHDKLVDGIEKYFTGATNVTEIKVPFFSDVLAAASFTYNDATYYGFYTRPVNTFDNSAMDILVVLDSEGKIAKVNIEKFFVNQYGFEYVVPSIGTFNKDEYANGFNGITGDAIVDGTFEPNGDYYITGATKTSLGIKAGLTSSFAVFNAIQGGNN